MKGRGRRRPVDAQLILDQVKREFGKKRDKLGAERAARELDVCLASFYNYVNGKTLPDLEVLRKAHVEWGIVWRYMDFSEIMRKQRVESAEQLVLGFLQAVREEDVEVIKVGREGGNLLKVALTIRFSAGPVKQTQEVPKSNPLKSMIRKRGFEPRQAGGSS
jgi:hypothetical protein